MLVAGQRQNHAALGDIADGQRETADKEAHIVPHRLERNPRVAIVEPPIRPLAAVGEGAVCVNEGLAGRVSRAGPSFDSNHGATEWIPPPS